MPSQSVNIAKKPAKDGKGKSQITGLFEFIGVSFLSMLNVRIVYCNILSKNGSSCKGYYNIYRKVLITRYASVKHSDYTPTSTIAYSLHSETANCSY
jgi:hypothetical protein